MAVTKPGYMLEHPSIRRYSSIDDTSCRRRVVTIRSVRTISRKPKPSYDHRHVKDRPPSPRATVRRTTPDSQAGGRERPTRSVTNDGNPCLPGNRNGRKTVPDTKAQVPGDIERWRPAGILRDCTPGPAMRSGDDTVRSSWRHGEPDRNDRARSST